MKTKCTECGGIVSDSTESCPHCGVKYPYMTTEARKSFIAFKIGNEMREEYEKKKKRTIFGVSFDL